MCRLQANIVSINTSHGACKPEGPCYTVDNLENLSYLCVLTRWRQLDVTPWVLWSLLAYDIFELCVHLDMLKTARLNTVGTTITCGVRYLWTICLHLITLKAQIPDTLGTMITCGARYFWTVYIFIRWRQRDLKPWVRWSLVAHETLVPWLAMSCLFSDEGLTPHLGSHHYFRRVTLTRCLLWFNPFII